MTSKDFKHQVERSSLGTRDVTAHRMLASRITADAVVRASKTGRFVSRANSLKKSS